MRTVHLGQFTDENIERVLDALDAAGIEHWGKDSGRFTRFFFAGEWGVRVFVDAERLEEAEEVVAGVLGGRTWK